MMNVDGSYIAIFDVSRKNDELVTNVSKDSLQSGDTTSLVPRLPS